jgi:hypothetical protein
MASLGRRGFLVCLRQAQDWRKPQHTGYGGPDGFVTKEYA